MLLNRLLILSACFAATIVVSLVLAADAHRYTDHSNLLHYIDDAGNSRPITKPKEWAFRRAHVLAGMEAAMGPLPDRANLPPLDVKVSAEQRFDGFVRQSLTFVSEVR